MNGPKPDLPQDVTFTSVTEAQAASLKAAYKKAAAADGVDVSFREQPEDDGMITLSVHFSSVSRVPNAALGVNFLVGFDAARDCGKLAGRIQAAKVNFVVRYYSHSAGKNLTASEAQLLSRAGIVLVSVWETLGDHVSFFTRPQGVDDATSAHNMAMQVGQPAGTPIYFAVDCDPVQDGICSTRFENGLPA